jgi:hypothetical protein
MKWLQNMTVESHPILSTIRLLKKAPVKQSHSVIHPPPGQSTFLYRPVFIPQPTAAQALLPSGGDQRLPTTTKYSRSACGA